MRISLVMPTWNAGPLLDEVLAAVRAQQAPAFDELLAIDSGSRDGTVERLLANGFRVASIPQREFDHGGTRDRGIAMTSGDVVVLLVQDATLQGTDWLAQMVAPFADPDVAGVWSRQTPRQKCQPVMKRRILGWPGWGDGVTVKRLPAGKRLGELPPFEQLMLCAFDNVASALRRTAWQRFPLGPRRFGEDVFFGKRVIEAGLALAHQGGAVAMHSHDRSAWAEGKRTFCDHRNLRSLFGLVGIPDRACLDGAILHGTKEHCDYVKGLGLPADEEAAALRWTVEYVKWQCWGQYMGAKAGARLPSPEGAFLRLLGKRLERGIG